MKSIGLELLNEKLPQLSPKMTLDSITHQTLIRDSWDYKNSGASWKSIKAFYKNQYDASDELMDWVKIKLDSYND
jgi:hypothetical protein